MMAASEPLNSPTGVKNYAGSPRSVLAPDVIEVADAAGGTLTGYSMAVDQVFAGTIGAASDTDWVAVDLVAGRSYVFLAWGVGGSSSGLSDTMLGLYNSSGGTLAFNNDINADTGFSAIQFTATATGTYYLGVDGYSTETGDYHLMVSDAAASPQQAATYLAEIDWGFTTPVYFTGSTITVNLTGLTAAGRQLARWALEAWQTALGVNFVETSSSTAQIIFDDNQAGAFAGPSSFSPSTGVNTRSTVNVSTSWLSSNGTTIDSYSYQTYLHEIGHALGLGHAGPYDGSANFGTDNIFANDSWLLSVMSYFSPTSNPNVAGDYTTILTPMLADLAAVHAAYGRPSAYAGHTVWGANSNIGGSLGALFGIIFDGDPANAGFYSGNDISVTVFDTGGTDTIDLSPVAVNQLIDQTPGSISNVAGVNGGLAIDIGTIIERAFGGSANDTIVGNAASNRLEGRGGNDSLGGGLGNDQVLGGDGNDVLSGGDGSDTVEGGAGNDSANGDNGNDTVRGGDGADSIGGGNGDDRMEGGEGTDQIGGGEGADLIFGGGGSDAVGGGAGNDTIYGGLGDDTIGAADGDDNVLGEDGNDLIAGGNGNDALSGGNGNDRLIGGTGNDRMTGGLGADVFLFTAYIAGESDLVRDFEDGIDLISMSSIAGSSTAERFGALTITELAEGARITHAGHTVNVLGVSFADFGIDDFVFV